MKYKKNLFLFFEIIIASLFIIHKTVFAATHCLPLGDIDCSGKVNAIDLSKLILVFGGSNPPNQTQDLDDSEKVNVIDLSILLSNFGKVATITPTPTPTPSSGNWWKPTTETPIHWHWQLSQDFIYPRDYDALPPIVTVFDIDGEYASASTVTQLHALGPNIKVICYFDAGVWENYREDASNFPGAQYQKDPNGNFFTYTGDPAYADVDIIGKDDSGWNDSFWMDTRRIDILQSLMDWRIKNWCKDKGFDAIEPDETENQDHPEECPPTNPTCNNNTGFNITVDETIAYNKMIADLAHSYNLSAGLKGNTTELAQQVQDYDWTLNEECWQYNECKTTMTAFLNYRDSDYYKNFGKAVFNIEYSSNPNCTWSNTNHMNSAKRDLNLVGPTNLKYLYQPCIPNNQDNW